MGLLDQVFNIIARDSFSGVYSNLHAKQQQAGKGFDTMGAASKALGVDLGSLGGLLGSLGIGFSALQLGKTALELGNLGAQSLRTKAVFESLTGSTTSATRILSELREASGNTVPDMALMQATITPLIGVTKELRAAFMEADPTLLALAKAVSDANPALGTATQLYAQFGEGLRKGVPKALESAGLVIEQKTVFDAFAASLGTTSAKLTDAQRSQALLNEVMRQAPDVINRIGTEADYSAEASERLSTAAGRLKIAIGEALAPATSGLQDTLAVGLTSLTAKIEGDELGQLRAQRAQMDALRQEIMAGPGSEEVKARQLDQLSQETDVYRMRTLELGHAQLSAAKASADEYRQSEAVRWSMRQAAEATDVFSTKTARMSAVVAGAVGTLRKMADEAVKASAALAERSIGQITGGLLGATDVITLQQYKGNIGATETAVKALTAAYKVGAIDLDTYNYKVAELSRANSDWISGLRESSKAVDDLGTSANNTAAELQSMIDGLLQPSFSLSDLAPELATQEGNIDEHYRRLAAIALRGGEELTKHAADWQNTLSLIPPDVQAQGITAIQEWAKAQVQAYDQGLDFSLIDKGAIKDRILRQLQANEARDAVIAEIAASLGSISMSDVQAAAKDAGLGAGGVVGKMTLGIEDSVDVDAMLRTTAAAITSGAQEKHAKALRESGQVVGGVILGGITTAVTEGAGDIINLLAAAVAPSVLAAVEARNRRAGGIPPS